MVMAENWENAGRLPLEWRKFAIDWAGICSSGWATRKSVTEENCERAEGGGEGPGATGGEERGAAAGEEVREDEEDEEEDESE